MVAPGCPRGTYSVGGSGCCGIEQGVAVGSRPAGSWGLEVPVTSVSALGPLASCPGCRHVPSLAWRLLDCGEGCPPRPLRRAWGRARALLVACQWRVVLSVADRPLGPGGRRQMSWTFRPPSGEGLFEAFLAARARPA